MGRTVEQEHYHREALKQAAFWQSQGEYGWADQWRARARSLKNTERSNNPALQMKPALLYKRPIEFQGATVNGFGDSLRSVESHRFLSLSERFARLNAVNRPLSKWYYDHDAQSCREYATFYTKDRLEQVYNDVAPKPSEPVYYEEEETTDFQTSWAEVPIDV